MPNEITMEMIDQRADELRAKIRAIEQEKDGEKIMKMAFDCKADAESLQALMEAFEHQEKAKYAHFPPYVPKIIKVELTDKQRKRVMEETGVRMEVVELEEDIDVVEEFMPEENPDEVERLAIEKARRMKAQAEGEQAAMQAAAAAISDIREVDNPELQALLDEKLADPDFLGGILHKK